MVIDFILLKDQLLAIAKHESGISFKFQTGNEMNSKNSHWNYFYKM